LPKIPGQRTPIDRFDGTGLYVPVFMLPASGGITQILPVRCFVTGTGKQFRVNKSLKIIDRMTVNALPVPGQVPGHIPQKPGSQVRHPKPWQDQKPAVVGDITKVMIPVFFFPTDISVPDSDVPGGR